MKSRGSLARNARFGASKSQDGRSFSRFAWQAQYFGGVSRSACCFCVAGAALSVYEFCFAWQAQHLVTWRRRGPKPWQGQHLVMSLKNCESIAKVILFHLCKTGFIRKTRRKSPIFTDGRRSDVLAVGVVLCSTE